MQYCNTNKHGTVIVIVEVTAKAIEMLIDRFIYVIVYFIMSILSILKHNVVLVPPVATRFNGHPL